MNTRISCSNCKNCNRKGKPSVTRYSKYCNENFKRRIKTKKGFINSLLNIKDKLFEKRFNSETKDLELKGFRKSWFKK
jgi:hypothetical protein